MLRVLMIAALAPFLLHAEESATTTETTEPARTSVPQLTDMATPPATAADQAVEDDSSDDSNVGVKIVKKMLNGFTTMGENRKKFLDGKQNYDKYMSRDAELSREVSANIDYYDVVEKSLKYDYDPKRKKFKRDHWAKKTQSDKNYFSNLFKGLVESIAYPLANEYFGDLNMKHKLVKQTNDDLHIKTLIKGKKSKKRSREFVVEWFLHPKADGGWIIYDISIEGERWVPGFRSQFNDVISKKSYKELLKMMKKKLGEEMADRRKKDFDALAERKQGKGKGDQAMATVSKKSEETNDGTADKN
jgi:hypothetical protein